MRILILALRVACSAPARRDKPQPRVADLAADLWTPDLVETTAADLGAGRDLQLELALTP